MGTALASSPKLAVVKRYKLLATMKFVNESRGSTVEDGKTDCCACNTPAIAYYDGYGAHVYKALKRLFDGVKEMMELVRTKFRSNS